MGGSAIVVGWGLGLALLVLTALYLMLGCSRNTYPAAKVRTRHLPPAIGSLNSVI